MELAVVGGPFDAVAVCAVSFDHSGICSVSPWGIGSIGDLVNGSVRAVASLSGGKARLVGDLATDRAVAAYEGQVIGVGAGGIGGVFHDMAYRVMGQQE